MLRLTRGANPLDVRIATLVALPRLFHHLTPGHLPARELERPAERPAARDLQRQFGPEWAPKPMTSQANPTSKIDMTGLLASPGEDPDLLGARARPSLDGPSSARPCLPRLRNVPCFMTYQLRSTVDWGLVSSHPGARAQRGSRQARLSAATTAVPHA